MIDISLLAPPKVREFVRDGYTVIRNAVPPPLIDEALRSINHQIGEGIHPEDLPAYRAGSYFPDITTKTAITDLVNKTAIYSYVETLIGINSILPVTQGQIALRFPILDGDTVKPNYHLDGQWGKFKNVNPEEFGANFSVLVYVMLNDMQESDCGNFTVIPGTHRLYEQHFREKGVDAFSKGMRKVEHGSPVQLTGSAGDIALMHYQLAHGPARNLSANIRYAAFFRLKNSSRDSYKHKTPTNIWLDFPAISHLVATEN